MRYFTIDELCHSNVADARGIDNTPGIVVTANLTALVDNLLDPIRYKWKRPIYVNSGYRCPELNAAVGGVWNSQHLTGEAADISVGSRELNQQLWQMITESADLVFDQLIDESNFSWIHISYRQPNRHQILHL